MRVEIVKKADGSGVLRCTRDSGSATWQTQTIRHAGFFALHDLTHFAVESALGLRSGFFGLIAQGWEIDDTTGKGSRGPLPEEARIAENLVGLFFAEQSSDVPWTAEDFRSFSQLPLTEEQVSAIRGRRDQLFAQWALVPVDGALTLEFPASATGDPVRLR